MWSIEEEEFFFDNSCSDKVLQTISSASLDSTSACECLLFLSRLLTTESLRIPASSQQNRHLLSPSTSITTTKDNTLQNSSSISTTTTTSTTTTSTTTISSTIDRVEFLLNAVEHALDAGILKTILSLSQNSSS
jgi:hypothetical protein